MTKERIDIRGLDEELYRRARADALSKGYKNIGAWMNEAITLKLGLHQMKFYIDTDGYPTLEDAQGGKLKFKEKGWETVPAEKKSPTKAGGRRRTKN